MITVTAMMTTMVTVSHLVVGVGTMTGVIVGGSGGTADLHEPSEWRGLTCSGEAPLSST